MAIMSVLMLGIGSAFMLASRAVPATQSVFRANADAAVVAQQMVTELHTAKALTRGTNLLVEFTVPDRDNNGSPELIRYEWDGAPAGTLSRTYNGGTPAVLADNVYGFALGYVTKSVSGHDLLQEMTISLRIGSDASAEIQTAVQTLNNPDITGFAGF